MYASTNFKTKKALKAAVTAGEQITLRGPGLGVPVTDGVDYIEGPWFPAPHTWYAKVTVRAGVIVKVT